MKRLVIAVVVLTLFVFGTVVESASAAIALRGTPTTTTSTTAATSYSFTTPTAAVSGDLLVATFVYRVTATGAADIANTAPTGWTKVPGEVFDPGPSLPGVHMVVAYKTAAGGAETPSWTLASAPTSVAIAVDAYSGAATSSPFENANYATEAGASSTTVHTAPAFTPTAVGTWGVASFGTRASETWTPGAGLTERTDSHAGTSGTGASEETADSNGVLTPGTAKTYSGTSSVGTSVAVAFAGNIKPAPTGETLLSQGHPATASSVENPPSSACAAMPGGSCAPGLAVDGLTTTRWSSLAGDPQWIYVDLGASYSISHVKLIWETAFGSGYAIQTSPDAVTWTDIFSTTTGDGGTDDLTGLTGTGRYVRMYGTARGTFPAHNWGYSLWEFQVYGTAATGDVTPPDTTITSAPSGGTNSTSASIGFTGTDNVGVTGFECKLDAGTFAACTSPQAYSGLADGSHTVSVRAKDAAGNVDPTPATASWTVDTTAPDTSITAGPSGATNNASPSFSFSSTEGGTFECRIDGAAFASCTSPKAYASLADGSHTFDVRAIDAVGNTDATPASRTFTVDTVAPDTTITAQPANPTTSTSADFSFTGSESGVTFQCSLDGAAYVTCVSPKSYTGLTVGSHTFTVKATDTASNTDATPASYTWTVQAPSDTTPPDTTITSAPSGASNSTSASIGFTGTDNVGVTGFECKLDAGTFSACTSPQAYTGLADGAHTVSVRAKDAAGNVDATPATATWTVDTTAPDTTITAQPANPTTSTSASFSFTSTETGTFQCSLDAGAYASCTSPKTYSALANGSHTFNVKATDGAGNTDATPATYTWTINAPSSDPLRISTTADRTGNVDLEGYVVASPTTQVCVYLSDTPAKTGSVVFYLDGVSTHTEGIVPWDYFGTAADGVNCLTGTFSAGTHTIRATWTGGEDSSTFSVTAAAPDTTPPTAPTNLAGTPGDAQASLSWTASTDNVAVTGYRVFRGGTQVGTPTGTTFTDTGLTNGTAYTYTVKAIDAAGNLSAASNSVSVTPQAGSPPPTSYSHIVWVIMENHGYNQIIGSAAAPYINSLVANYGSATNMFAESHPSLPNYLAMTSGSQQGVTDDANPPSHPLNVENIFHQLGGGQSKSLMDSMPSNCYKSDFIDASGGKYSAHHNPMAYYTNLGTDCANYDVPLASTPDVSSKFTFVVPNQTNNMHDGTITQGDSFLQGFIPKIQATADYQAGKTAIFVTWDEDEGTEGNHVPTLIVHPNGAHNTTACQGTRYDHYSMLRFVEDNFGLARVGNAATANSMSACFGLSSAPPPTAQPNGPTGTWNLAWSDEFNGTSLDTTKWVCNGWTNNRMTAGSLCSNITEANGQAKLVLDAGNHGAQMGSNLEYGATNGYLLPVGGVAEARVYLPGDAANCSGGVYNWGGFWTGASSIWPRDGEIDIEETLGGQASTNFHGFFNNAQYDLNGPKPAGCWANAFHTFTVKRGTTTDDVYWDGNLVWTVTTHDDGSGEALLVTNGYSGNSANVLGDPGALLVDYVRAWVP